MMKRRIQRNGTSKAVLIPSKIAELLGLEIGSPISIDVVEHKIVIAPLPSAKIEAVQTINPVKGMIAHE